jgi:hypothetical protein
MLPRDSEDIERREMSRLAARFHIEIDTYAPNEFPQPLLGCVLRRHTRTPERVVLRGKFKWLGQTTTEMLCLPYLCRRI